MESIYGKHIPMLQYALFFAAGILCSEYTGLPYVYPVLAGTILTVFFLYRLYHSNRVLTKVLLLTALLLMLILGSIRYLLWQESQRTVSGKETTILRVNSFPEHKNGYLQFEAKEVQSLLFSFFDTKRCMVRCGDTLAAIAYGDLIQVQTPYLAAASGAIPYQFDYATYLRSKGILFTIEVCSVTRVPNAEAGWFYTWINSSRIQFKQTMALIFDTKGTRALAESLLLGYRDELESSTKESFQNSGVSHLLAVSGMHTALIYQMVFLFFLPLGSSQKHRIVFLICALSVLIYFTVLSGCTTSVLRSAIMCGTFALGYTFRKKGTGLNTLGTSILIMLWMNPYQIHDVGFQLSVMAVFGILTIHRNLSVFFEHKNKFQKYLLESVSICISAQIMTLPVILYHFHSFPLYFIPANLLLIPISTLALFSTMVAVLLAGIGVHVSFFFRCCRWLIELFEWCAHFFASLPYSVIHPISFTGIEAVCVLLLSACYLFSRSLQKAWLWAPVAVCLFWSVCRITNDIRQCGRMEEYMIQNYRKSGLLTIRGKEAHLYSMKEYHPRERKNMQEYFTLTVLHMHVVPEQTTATHWNNEKGVNRVWLHKNCPPDDTVSVSHLFYSGYTLPDKYEALNVISLNKKSLLRIP